MPEFFSSITQFTTQKISPRARHKTAYWSNITWFEKYQEEEIYRDIIEARGVQAIFLKVDVTTRNQEP